MKDMLNITLREFSGPFIQFITNLLGDDGVAWWDGFKRFLRKENPWEVAIKGTTTIIQKVTNLLKAIKEGLVGATNEKNVSESFVGKLYHPQGRDSDLDKLFPQVSRAGIAGKITAWQLEKELNSKEIAQGILGLDEASTDDVAKGLIAGGHTVVLPQIELLIERTEAGEDVWLRTDGWGNFFFVENAEGSVSVVGVDRRDGGLWRVFVYRLDYEFRWIVGSRFFSRN